MNKNTNSSETIDRVVAMQKILLERPPNQNIFARIKRRVEFRRRQRQIESSIKNLRASGVVIPLEPFHGSFELPLSNNMTRRLLGGGYEVTQQLLLKAILKPNDHVVDVGANLGLFSVLAGSLVGPFGKVLAVEPVPNMLNHLHGNLRRNNLKNVIVFEGVASDKREKCHIHTVEGGEEYSSLYSIAHPNRPRGKEIKIEIEGVPIDDLVAIHQLSPSVLKVDTEGAEGLVFSGATAILRDDRPLILSELDDRLLKGFGWTSAKVVCLLINAGYAVFDQNTWQVLTTNTQNFVGDIIGIPEEVRTAAKL